MVGHVERVDDECMSSLGAIVAILLLMGPVLVLVIVGVWRIGTRAYHWRTAGIATALGIVVWGFFVALYEHETPCGDAARCPTIYGFVAPLAEPNPLGFMVLVGGMVWAAALLGVTRKSPSITIGAFLVALPALLAWWTAPRGDNDGLWVLIFWPLAFVGAFSAGCAETARATAVSYRQRRASR